MVPFDNDELTTIAEGSQVSIVVTFCHGLKLTAPDGKLRETDCANTEGIFRIIQSIPSPKAEPFKRWLAKVGYERVQEIEDPELATKRTRALYKAKGYSDDWIEKRIRGIAIREELTDEWKKREVKENREYEILTAEIAKAAFGITPGEHKKLKGLKRENLRDHMTDLELIFSMLGEAATTEITRVDDSKGFHESKQSARKGGEVAGKARKDLEKETGKRVVSTENYLTDRRAANGWRGKINDRTILPPLKPTPMKDRVSVIFIEKGNLDVLDGAFVVVDKNGVRTHIPVGGVACLMLEPVRGCHMRR